MQVTIDKDGKLATLHTRPTATIMRVLNQFEGFRRFVSNGHLRFEPSVYNLNLLREVYPDLDVVNKSALPNEEWASEFDGYARPYETKTVPLDHQEEAIAKARPILLGGNAGFALFMEQGTGKTKVAIDLAGEMHAAGKIDALLVIAKNGVHRQWIASEFPKHFGGEWKGAFWPTRKKLLPDELLDPGPLKVFTINWDGARAKAGKIACLQFVQAHRGRILIVGDETHEIKNNRSARWKAANEIARHAGRPFRRMALTGTPIAKDLTDEWSQLLWLDESILGMRYATAFRNQYCIMGGYEGKEVIGQKNVEAFREKVDPFSFRATKDDLGILPKQYRQWKFDLSPDQRRQLREMKTTLEAQIDSGDIVTSAHAAVALTKMQQISNGFIVDNDGEVHFTSHNPRLLALKEVLDAYEGPTIVWARFQVDISMISALLRETGETFVPYVGDTPPKQREENVQKFLSGKARIFLSNPQAGGTGLNLQEGGCRHAIYYSNGYAAIDRWQSEDRIHRIGTKGVCVYTDLVATGSVDAAILANLRKKKNVLNLAVGDIRQMLEEVDV